ncbi:C40 family peptidase [Jonesia denitrificans]|uniref:NLP/P60 protein n=1 Tax=Jonesia denitrificans (strain ATCC 14870 / DSM 20603 / BCRC 15368 / CIP 55.134 / JCM 11481 / NBRC 15587 / NCTC 10816 / Prevot 55134) TaxID=471856 RepID=C7R123_JONDD|nr:NlpC/P60 family protein [Jonesia denitrificans]ACV09747.1 NLP/P60 protein [Jonesia denitrificans DSM 20603]ASE09044.1 hypothetical protein CEP80_07760 [Jonesia denitrificans]QXB43592.1 C40 family peptidase [Jonesia denitrificans]SQH22335.1 Probable endopeptidase p60 precursor [Jonesia denitrificans]
MTSPGTPHRRRRAITAALVCALTATVATPAGADPTDDPSPSESITTRAHDVAALDVEIAQLEQQVDDAYTAVISAGEDYLVAEQEFHEQEQFADSARQRALEARERADASRIFVARMARESSRSSYVLDTLSALLTSNGLDQAITEANALEAVTDKADQRIQQFQADQVVADVLERAANDATQEARAKRDAASEALQHSQVLQTQAEAQAAQAQTQREDLLAQLAEARQTSIAQEQARQERLAQERAEREAQEARDRIEREEQDRDGVTVGEVPRPGDNDAPNTPDPTPTRTQDPDPQPTRTPTPDPAPTRTQDPDPQPTRTPTPDPTPTRTPTPDPTPTRNPDPEPTKAPEPAPPSSDLGKGTSVGSAAQGRAAVAAAKKRIGKPYKLGGSGPTYFDCSGLTSTAWAEAGVSITRTSRSQYQRVKKISMSNMRPGDLLFWGSNTSNPSTIYHVAMYVGGGQMIEAARPGIPVKITSVRYDTQLFPYAGRP